MNAWSRTLWNLLRVSHAMRVLIAIVLVVSACTSPSAPPVSPPSGESELVLRMTEWPSMLPPGGGLTMPTISIYGGGLVVVKASSELVQRKLTAAGVTRVAQAAAGAGLAGRDISNPDGIDVPSATFVLVTGGQRYVTHVVNPRDAKTGERRRVRDFMAKLSDLDGMLGSEIGKDSKPYVHSRLAVFAVSQDSSSGAKEWRLNDLKTAGAPYETGRCQVVQGAELEQLRGVDASGLWRSANAIYHLTPRPMLPDETGGCPSLVVS